MKRERKRKHTPIRIAARGTLAALGTALLLAAWPAVAGADTVVADPGGLTAGETTGIVVAVLVVGAAGIYLLWRLAHRRREDGGAERDEATPDEQN